jgi:hypothetical protein
MKTSIITLLCFIAITSCTNSPKDNEIISEAQKKEAQTVAQNFLDILAINDSASILAAFSGNPEVIYSMGGEFIKMNDFIPESRKALSNRLKQTFENLTDHYFFINSTTFIYDYRCLNKVYEKSGVVTIIDPVCCSYTFQKEKEGWKVVHMHETWMNVKVDSSMVNTNK